MATGRVGRGYNRRSFGGNQPRNNPQPFRNSPTAHFIPGSDVRPEEVFTYPFLVDEKTIEYFTKCKKVMFIIRGFSGTGKTTLSAMIATKYPAGVVCSADSYFSQAFVDKFRSRESLKESHEFCQRRVKQECQKGTHPIIVQNTHIKKWELSCYTDFAAEYGYNVIFVVTHRKFQVSAKILAQTNKKGLKEEYFQVRLNQWQECIPVYTGWFFGQDDTKFIAAQVKLAFKVLLEDSKFCRAMNAFTEDEIWKRYYVEDRPFCIASYTDCGKQKCHWDYYLSEKVQEAYGKCFSMEILGMVVTKSEVLLLVPLNVEMSSLVDNFENVTNEKADSLDDALSSAFSSLNVRDHHQHNETESAKSTFDQSFSPCDATTAELVEWDDENLSINVLNASFIRMGRKDKKRRDCSPIKLVRDLLSPFVDKDQLLFNSEEMSYREFTNGTKYIRLPEESWFMQMPQRITVNSFFCSLYRV